MVPAVPSPDRFDIETVRLTPASRAKRIGLLSSALPLWQRALPADTVALVVGRTAEIPEAEFRDALIELADHMKDLGFTNPIPAIHEAVGKLRAKIKATAEIEASRKAEADRVAKVEAEHRARGSPITTPAEASARVARLAKSPPPPPSPLKATANVSRADHNVAPESLAEAEEVTAALRAKKRGRAP